MCQYFLEVSTPKAGGAERQRTFHKNAQTNYEIVPVWLTFASYDQSLLQVALPVNGEVRVWKPSKYK